MARLPRRLTIGFDADLISRGRKSYAEKLEFLAGIFSDHPDVCGVLAEMLNAEPDDFRESVAHAPEVLVTLIQDMAKATVLAIGNREAETSLN